MLGSVGTSFPVQDEITELLIEKAQTNAVVRLKGDPFVLVAAGDGRS